MLINFIKKLLSHIPEPPEIKLIYDDEALLILPKCSQPQKDTEAPLTKKNTHKVPFLHRCKTFLASCLNSSPTFFPFPDLQDIVDVFEDYSSQPKVFVVHHKGQQLPPEWREQVPSNTLLIVVNLEDWPEHNCFEAQPVPLEHLWTTSQPGEPMNNRRYAETP